MCTYLYDEQAGNYWGDIAESFLHSEMIQFNKKEALRYFRAQPGDAQAGAAIDVAYEKLRNELQPRYTVKRFWLQGGRSVCVVGQRHGVSQ